jgi:flagellar biosynthesis regulator FlaF
VYDVRHANIVEPETRQHQLLTETWLEAARDQYDDAAERLNAAYVLFEKHNRIADHTAQLLARLSRLSLPAATLTTIATWRKQIAERHTPLRD